MNVMSILEIQGIKYSGRSFQIEIAVLAIAIDMHFDHHFMTDLIFEHFASVEAPPSQSRCTKRFEAFVFWMADARLLTHLKVLDCFSAIAPVLS